MSNTEIFYHGTCVLFDKFSLSFVGTGQGGSKYGRGVNISSSYKTAALYAAKAAKNRGAEYCYVYTVEVPLLEESKSIFSNKPVNGEIVARVEAAIGETMPDEVKVAGKLFRKYLGNLLTNKRSTVKKMMNAADDAAENAAAEFLSRHDVVYLAWPRAQTKPDGDTNRLVLNADDVKILKIEQVEVDSKNNLIEGSEKLIK